MPGLNDPSQPRARHLSSFFPYRTAVEATEPAPTSEVPDLNFCGSPDALNNNLCVVVRRTTGTSRLSGDSRIKLAFYFQPQDKSDLAGVWLLDRTSDWLALDTLYKFYDLYAGKYRLVVAALDVSGDTLDVYVAQEGNLLSRKVE